MHRRTLIRRVSGAGTLLNVCTCTHDSPCARPNFEPTVFHVAAQAKLQAEPLQQLAALLHEVRRHLRQRCNQLIN